MALVRFACDVVGYVALLGTVYVWTVFGHAIGF